MELIAEGGESSVYRVRPGIVMRRFEANARARASGEWTILQHLRQAAFPVPEPIGLVELGGGAIGVQMEEIQGPTGAARLRSAAAAERPALVQEWGRLLSRLHRVDTTGLRLDPPFNSMERLGEFAAPAAVAVLAPAQEWLSAHRVAPLAPTLLHTDYHGQNLMHRASGELVVIDWSLAALGDPRIDLGYTTALVKIEGNGWMAEAILAGYEGETPDLAHFEVQAAVRRLALFLTMLAEGPERLGLRPGLDADLREKRSYLEAHLAFLEAMTGLRLPNVAEAIASW